jgi:dihydropteroate synthase
MKILGILNITEDSFSDGGEYLNLSQSLLKVDSLVSEGADILDIGAQSSNINSKLIPANLEWERIYPVAKYLKEKSIPISVDTYKPEVIQKCLEFGVDYINDITALENPKSKEVIQTYLQKLSNLILMYSHSRSTKAEKNSYLKPETIWDEILFFLDKKRNEMIKLGVSEEKLIFDPGMGLFLGEDPALSFIVLKKISLLKKEFKRVLISVSRKSFLGAVLGGIEPKSRTTASVVAELYAYTQGVDFIRTHSPLPLKQAITIWKHIQI